MLMAGCGGSDSGKETPDPAPAPAPSSDPAPAAEPATAADPAPTEEPTSSLRDMFMQLKEDERAKILVKGTLQSAYLGKADQEYREPYYVDADAIGKSYESTKEAIAGNVMKYLGIDSSQLGADAKKQVSDMVGELLKFHRVTIGPSGWNGADKYDVMVKVYPIDTLMLLKDADLAAARANAASEDAYATACVDLLQKAKSRTDNEDEGQVFLVTVQVGDNGMMTITTPSVIDDIHACVILTEK